MERSKQLLRKRKVLQAELDRLLAPLMPNKPKGTIKGTKTTKPQQKLMGIARGIQKGDTSPSYSKAASRIATDIAPADLHNIAKKPKGGFRKKK